MLRRTYKKAKFLFDEAVKRLVWAAYWVLEQSIRSHNERIYRAALKFTMTVGNVGEFLMQLPRLDAVRVSGSVGTLIYVGESDIYKLYLLRTLFPDGYEETEVGRVFLWKLPSITQWWLRDNELVILRLSRYYPWRINAKYAFANPINVDHVLTLGRTMDELLAGGRNSKLRADVNRMRKSDFKPRISHSMDDLHFFYHRMFIPTIQQRHQDLSNILPYHVFERLFRKGELFFLSLEGRDLCGSLQYTQNGVLYAYFIGILDGDTSLMQRVHLSIAAYWHLINYAIDTGIKKINFMGTNAWVSDSIFYHKQRWGTHAQSTLYFHDHFLFRSNHLTDEWVERINQIGFITREGDKFLRVYVDAASPSVKQAHDLAVRNGLDGIQIVNAGSHVSYANRYPEPIALGSEIQ